MNTLKNVWWVLLLSIGLCSQDGCAQAPSAEATLKKAPHEAWTKLARGEQQDLIVELDDTAIIEQALQLNKRKGIMFDDHDTLRFKAEHYAEIKQAVIAGMPSSEVEVLKQYDLLPLMFLRFHSTAALKALLAHPSVVQAYEDTQAHLMH